MTLHLHFGTAMPYLRGSLRSDILPAFGDTTMPSVYDKLDFSMHRIHPRPAQAFTSIVGSATAATFARSIDFNFPTGWAPRRRSSLQLIAPPPGLDRDRNQHAGMRQRKGLARSGLVQSRALACAVTGLVVSYSVTIC